METVDADKIVGFLCEELSNSKIPDINVAPVFFELVLVSASLTTRGYRCAWATRSSTYLYHVVFELFETLPDMGVLVSKGVKNERAMALETCG